MLIRKRAVQGLNQQVSETIEASRQLMRLGPREVDSLAAQVRCHQNYIFAYWEVNSFEQIDHGQ